MEITHVTGGTSTEFVQGSTSGTVTTFSAGCFSEIDGSIVSCLRSRGDYGSDQIIDWNVPLIDDAVMTNTDAILTDPFASFNITGTSNGQSFNFDVR